MLLDEVGAYVAASGLGVVGTDLFLAQRPEAPDFCTTLYETAGQVPVRAFASLAGQAKAVRPGLQIVVRGNQGSYQPARLRADALVKLLDGLGDVTLSGVRYLWIGARGEPQPMGFDVNQRPLIAVNFDVVKAQSTA